MLGERRQSSGTYSTRSESSEGGENKSRCHNRIHLFDCPMDNLSMAETLCRVEEFVRSGRPHQHVVINVDKLVKFHRDPALAEAIESCHLISVDGQPIVWASRLLGKPIKERVAGIDLMDEVIRLSASRGYGVFFLGAREHVVRRTCKLYCERLPELRVCGMRNGYWTPEEEESIVQGIRDSGADILFVAISSPKKELFLGKHLGELSVPFVMGVGGSFDVVAGLRKRAPRWMQKCSLEWFYRFCQEPRRMWRRYFVDDLAFAGLVLREVIRTIKRDGSQERR